MAQWKFQLLPSKKDLLGVGYRMDAVGQAVEDEVYEAMPCEAMIRAGGHVEEDDENQLEEIETNRYEDR